MLIIDKKQEAARFILTLSETIQFFEDVELEIVSHYSNSKLTVALANDISDSPDRYNEFVFDISVFSSLKGGKHSYNVKYGGQIIERGILVVFDDSITEDSSHYIAMTYGDTDAEYLILEYGDGDEIV